MFTGGIGQNSPEIRAEIMSSFAWAGVDLDPQLNANTVGETTASISRPGTKLPVYVIPTNEELLIARDTVRCI